MDKEPTENLEIIKNLNLDENKNNFISKKPNLIVAESFRLFLQHSQIDEENIREKLSREKINEWDFLKEIEPFLNEGIQEIPFLNEFYNNELPLNNENLQLGRLVKFNCMIQNVFENQLYMGVGYDNNNKVVLNQFYEHEVDYSPNLSDSNQMMAEENLYTQVEDYTGAIYMERLVLNCVPLPGLSPSLFSELKLSQKSLDTLSNKKIIVYDYSNQSHKVNEEILVIGVVYERENEITIHSWKIVNDYITSFQNKPVADFNFNSARDLIYGHFMNFFNEDELMSEYLILFLTSQIFSRVVTHFIGKLSINLINQKPTVKNTSEYVALLQNFIKLITNFTVTFTPTLESLNTNFLYPRYDIQSEELHQGILQTPNHTFLIIDERSMDEGKLEDVGCRNFNQIKNLVDFQLLQYEYPYSQVEINHDTQILIITDVVKSLFNSPQLIEIPFMNQEDTYNTSAHNEKLSIYDANLSNISDIHTMRLWFNLTRYSDSFNKNFVISSLVSENIQKDFLKNKTNFSADDFDNSIKLARLYAISYGKSELSLEDYLFIRQMELRRKERINKLKK